MCTTLKHLMAHMYCRCFFSFLFLHCGGVLDKMINWKNVCLLFRIFFFLCLILIAPHVLYKPLHSGLAWNFPHEPCIYSLGINTKIVIPLLSDLYALTISTISILLAQNHNVEDVAFMMTHRLSQKKRAQWRSLGAAGRYRWRQRGALSSTQQYCCWSYSYYYIRLWNKHRNKYMLILIAALVQLIAALVLLGEYRCHWNNCA